MYLKFKPFERCHKCPIPVSGGGLSLDGEKWVPTQPKQDWVLRVFGSYRDKVLPSLVLEGVALSQTDRVCTDWGSLLLLKVQVAAVARRVFAHFWMVHQLCFSTKKPCSPPPHTPCNLSLRLLQHAIHTVVLTLKSIWKLQLMQNRVSADSKYTSQVAYYYMSAFATDNQGPGYFF